jgi:hypothetical protein
MYKSDSSGTINTSDSNWYTTKGIQKNQIIGELLGIVWDKKFTQYPEADPQNAYYLFYTTGLTTDIIDSQGTMIGKQKISGYFYIPWRSSSIIDESGKILPVDGDPEKFWRGTFSGWGSAKQSIKSDVAPKDESFLGQVLFYLIKYWYILIILLFYKTILQFIKDVLNISKKFKR